MTAIQVTGRAHSYVKTYWCAGIGLIGLFNCIGHAHADAPNTAAVSCIDHPEQQPAISTELQTIVSADQADRQVSPDRINWAVVGPRDRERHARVAEIVAGGCLKDARDFAAAALVFQHGETADDVYQTFLWAKKAVDLGDSSRRWLTVAGLDRYLVRTGRKQLFATQYGKDTSNPCWCLEPVESTFPDGERVIWANLSLDQALGRLKSDLNQGQRVCDEVQYCHHDLKATPAGSVSGFW